MKKHNKMSDYDVLEPIEQNMCLIYNNDIYYNIINNIRFGGQFRNGDYLVHTVCSYGTFKMIQYAFESGKLNFNQIDKYGWTPFHIICSKITNFCYEEQLKVIKYFVENY